MLKVKNVQTHNYLSDGTLELPNRKWSLSSMMTDKVFTRGCRVGRVNAPTEVMASGWLTAGSNKDTIPERSN